MAKTLLDAPGATPSRLQGLLLPSELPGVDLAAGLAMSMDSPGLYRSLLATLPRMQGHFAKDVRAALARGDVEIVRQHARKARGACGQLGAQATALAAEALEDAILFGAHADALRAVAAVFCEQHEGLVDAIRARVAPLPD